MTTQDKSDIEEQTAHGGRTEVGTVGFTFEDTRRKLIAKRNSVGAETVEIEAANGRIIIFDRVDYPLLSPYTWCALIKPNGKGYATAHVPGSGDWPRKKQVKMHRLLMNPPPGFVVHHKNDDGLDNRRCNLEVTTNRVNVLYDRKGRGVSFMKEKNRWRARGTDENGRRVDCGLYLTEAEALQAVHDWRQQKAAELETQGTLEALQIAQILRRAA
jgi:hypothetical protein